MQVALDDRCLKRLVVVAGPGIATGLAARRNAARSAAGSPTRQARIESRARGEPVEMSLDPSGPEIDVFLSSWRLPLAPLLI